MKKAEYAEVLQSGRIVPCWAAAPALDVSQVAIAYLETLGMHRVLMLGFLGLLRLPEAGLHAADKWRLNHSQIEAILSAPEDPALTAFGCI